MSDAAPDWPARIFEALEGLGVRQVSYVPDAGHRRLIELCESAPKMASVVLTTEEEGIAMAAGAWLGGDRPALLMQSSGVGNCINMLGLLQACRCPLLMLVTMRGEFGEFNPWQVPMGQATADVLRAVGVLVERLDDPADAELVVSMMGRLAFEGQRPVALLIGQRLIGAKSFGR
jgi:sulfopyruvate decarboxylase alpha subunit